MKHFYSLFLMLIIGTGINANAQLVTYSFDDGFAPTQANGLLQASTFKISSGNILLVSTTAQGLTPPYAAGNGWTAMSRDSARYFYADITARDGFVIDITRISAVGFATASGPTVAAIRINDSNFEEVAVPSAQVINLDTGELNEFNGLSTIRIRFEAWLDQSRPSSGGGAFRVDDVIIEGVVRSVSDDLSLALISEPEVNEIGVNGARVSSRILFDGNQGVTSWGVLLGAVADSLLIPDAQGVSFLLFDGELDADEILLDNLMEAERYGIRTVAINASGTALSEVVRFNTKRGFGGAEYVGSFADADVGFLAGPEWVFSDQQVVGVFGSGTGGGLRAGDGVVGYLLTNSLNRFHAELTLVNTTGERLDEVIVGYHGWVSRTGVERSPVWEVSVNGVVYPELAYSTEKSVIMRGIQYLIDDLSVEPGEKLVIRWSTESAPGSGGHRQIGLSDVIIGLPSTVHLSLNGDAGWRMFSVPYWYPSSDIIGEISPFQGFTGQNYPPNVYSGYDGANWIALGMDSTQVTQSRLTPGTGHLVYVFDNDSGGSVPIGSGRTFQLTGLDLTATDVRTKVHADGDRWNLLGNPFPVAFDIRSLQSSYEGVPIVQIWKDSPGRGDAGSPAGGSWVLSNNSLINHIIPAGQGFMWQNSENSPSTEVVFPQTGRLPTTGNRFRNPIQTPQSRVEFVLSTTKSMGHISEDRSFQLVFTSDYESVEDFKIDKLGSLSNHPQVMFVDGAETGGLRYLAQQALSFNFEGETMLPLAITQVDSTVERLTLSWPFLLDIPSYWVLEFYNEVTGQRIDLRDTGAFDIDITGSIQSIDSWVLIVRNLLISNSISSGDIPGTTRLHHSYPNPFNPSTTIRYELAGQYHVRIEVFDVLGRLVATLLNTEMSQGVHELKFDAAHLNSGTYLLRMATGDYVSTDKITLIK